MVDDGGTITWWVICSLIEVYMNEYDWTESSSLILIVNLYNNKF